MKIFDNNNTQEFKSWDEIKFGDELVWFRGEKYGGYYIEFTQKTDGPIVGYINEALIGGQGDLDSFDPSIYPDQRVSVICGWKKVISPELKYDPNQQGDTDEDI